MLRALCEKGFALIEFSLSLLTSLSIAVFFISLIYTAAAKLWLNQVTYDAVICLAQGEAKQVCEVRLRTKARWVGASLDKAQYKIHSRAWALRVGWKLPKGISLHTASDLNQRSYF